MDCTIYVAKTKALISFAVTAKLICVFVFAYAKRWFSHDAAQLYYPCREQQKSDQTILADLHNCTSMPYTDFLMTFHFDCAMYWKVDHVN